MKTAKNKCMNLSQLLPHADGVATHILQEAGHVRLVPELRPREEMSA